MYDMAYGYRLAFAPMSLSSDGIHVTYSIHSSAVMAAIIMNDTVKSRLDLTVLHLYVYLWFQIQVIHRL